MSTLRIIAAAGEGAPLRWLRLAGGEVSGRGEEHDLAWQEGDDHVELILPAERVALIQVPVSAEQQARLSDDNLPWLVEANVVQDAERLHLVRGDLRADGLLTVAAVDRAWLQGVCARLAARSLRPRRIVSEAFVGAWREGEWTVVLRADGGWLRLGRQSAFALDRTTGGETPATLQLALDKNPHPERMVVFGDEGVDCAPWSASLGVPVQESGKRDWSAAIGDGAIDLARGPFAPPGRGGHWWQRLRPSAWLLAGVLAVNGIGWAAYGMIGAFERTRLQGEINAELLRAFPETKVVLDPLLQMRQGVDRLARGSGAATPGDLLPLLGRVAEAGGARLAGRTHAIQYEPGKLALEVGLPDQGAVEALRAALQAAAINARFEPLPASPAAPVRIRVSVTP